MSSQFGSDGESIEQDDRNAVQDLKITKARCDKFVINQDASLVQSICFCGLPFEEHHESVKNRFLKKGSENGSEKWVINNCVAEDGLTDAFGEVRFTSNNDHIGKYIRVNYKTDPSKMVKLLFDYWKLDEPTLIISVTGGAQKFSLKPKLQEVFRRGLVKAASSTGAWISTGGFNVGVMKHVGEAVREGAATSSANEKIVVLGIATWTMVQNKDLLIRKEAEIQNDEVINDFVVDYPTVANWEKEKQSDNGHRLSYLDPNHTNFILVDNAQIRYGGEINFRGNLEAAISKRGKEQEIPMVILVLEGGVGTIRTVLESVRNGTPCVFIEVSPKLNGAYQYLQECIFKGSGKVADLLAFAIQSVKNKKKKREETINIENQGSDRAEEYKIKNSLREKYREWTNDDVEKMYPLVVKARKRIDTRLEAEIRFKLDELKKEFKNPKIQQDYVDAYEDIEIILGSDDLLNVFSLDDDNDIDIIILTAFLKAKKNNYEAQLKLAMSWNRVDIAKNFIFKQDVKLDPEQLNQIMFKAILDDRVDFVQLILENDFNLKSFLTSQRLRDLYRQAFRNDKNRDLSYLPLLLKMKEHPVMIDAKLIKDAIQKSVEDLYTPKFIQIESSGLFENPKYELFIFSILMVRPSMANVFFRDASNPIFLALIASKIFRRLSRLREDNDKRNFEKHANDFESLAEKLLEHCFKADERIAQRLLLKKLPEFENLSCLQVAISANDKSFVSHPAVQNVLTKLWYDKIMPHTSILRIFPCILIPLLVPGLILFREPKMIKHSSSSRPTLERTTSIMVEEEDRKRKNPIEVFRTIYFFVRAPIVKFTYFQLFYALFLILFSYIMLCDFFPIPSVTSNSNLGLAISIPEIVLIIWASAYLIDEIRQFTEIDVKILKARIRIYFENYWNITHLLALVLFYIGLILRFIPGNYDVYLAARVILCIDLLIWYINTLSFYTIIKQLGPKIAMIYKMLYQLTYFIFIVIVFMFAFGVSTQALMYHNQELGTDLLKNVFFPSYFFIGGEFYTRNTIMTASTCIPSNTSLAYFDKYTQNDCPNIIGAQFALAIYVVYLVILNILLINLLIAIFSNTFNEVQKEADKIWKYQRYSFIYEYFHKPILPPPFSLFSYMISSIRLILSPIRARCCKTLKADNNKNPFKRLFIYFSKPWSSGFNIEMDKNEEKMLTKWEERIAQDYLHQEERSSRKNHQNHQIDKLNRKMNKIMEALNLRLNNSNHDDQESFNNHDDAFSINRKTDNSNLKKLTKRELLLRPLSTQMIETLTPVEDVKS